MKKSEDFKQGLKAGLAIALGYLPVSFSFGMIAVSGGIPPLAAVIISMTNLTSAGQFAGTELIIAGGSLTEIGLATFIINLRYMLMSFSLSQKIEKMPLAKRMIAAFGITDEIFAVASVRPGKQSFEFLMGLIALPYIGWAVGTLLGAYINNLLPQAVASALGITLYAMFIAIIIPVSKKSKAVLFVVILSAVLSCILYYSPLNLSSGWSVIIVSVTASAFGALVFPRRGE